MLLDKKPKYVEAEPYDYDYLETNISLDEIRGMQPYKVEFFSTSIYSTYRTWNGNEYLYVMNRSEERCEKQRFDFGSKIQSFIKLNLRDMSETFVPLEVVLNPGEDALFIPSTKSMGQNKELQNYSLRFEHAVVSIKENYLPIDYVRYSLDGKTYSKPWPCAALFKKLLKEQYSGEIYFCYEFEIEEAPKHLLLRVEKSRDLDSWLNGEKLEAAQTDTDAYIYDITEKVVCGSNKFTILINWYEDDKVHYALFGENVTESLKNCLAYDTELQPIELIGEFGVYSGYGYKEEEDTRFVHGKNFYIGKLPEFISEPSVEGFPFFAGEMTLSQKIQLNSTNVLLNILGEYQMAFVKLNGVPVGTLLFEKEIDISKIAKIGENEVEIEFIIGNKNRMGPHHFVGEKDGNIDPWKFDLFDHWDEDRCKLYHEEYDIKKFYTI